MEELPYAGKGTGIARVESEVARTGPVDMILITAGTRPMMPDTRQATSKWICAFSAADLKNRYREPLGIRYSE